MKKIILSLLSILISTTMFTTESQTNMKKIDVFAENGYKYDSFTTADGRPINIVFIKHGSIAVDIDNFLVYIDPVTMFGNDFSVLPKADMILVTHEHHDHLDPKAIDLLRTEGTSVMTSAAVAQMINSEPLKVGQKVENEKGKFTFTTFPAYNNTPDHLGYHPKSRGDVGFVFDVDGFKIYVAGDTEDIVEMESLGDKGVDVAFLPVNQPFTMTPAQAIHATEMIKPRILYPYHYGQTDLSPIVDRFSGSDVDVRIRELQ